MNDKTNMPLSSTPVSHHATRNGPGIFKMMAEPELAIQLSAMGLEGNVTFINSDFDSGESGIKRSLPFSLVMTLNESETKDHTDTLSCITDLNPTTEIAGLSAQEINKCIKKVNTHEAKDVSSENKSNSEQHNVVNIMKDKENCIHTAMASTTTGPDNVPHADRLCQRSSQATAAPPLTPTKCDDTEDSNAEVVRRAQEKGRVDVVFPGTVTQEGCCRFVSEILKCLLYQRQQLPMTYDQLVHSHKKRQDAMQSKEVVSWRPMRSTDLDWRKCQRTLQDLEEVLQQLEALFSLSLVPRVLLLLGGSLVLPKEMYEINMEALAVAAGDQSLRASSCLRQLFHTLFVADLLSDARPVRLMATAVLVLAHRDCGVGWFRPKLDFKVPTRVKRQIISLSSDAGICGGARAEMSDREDYVWFQAPTAIKGFSK